MNCSHTVRLEIEPSCLSVSVCVCLLQVAHGNMITVKHCSVRHKAECNTSIQIQCIHVLPLHIYNMQSRLY